MARKRRSPVPGTSSSGTRARSRAMDRLSDLPDDVLHHVMSFLTTRQAVQTCVLSKRWAQLWRTVPCLDIDQWEFRRYQMEEEDEYQRFADFTNKLLSSHRAPCLESFRMRLFWDYCNERAERDVQRWVRRGMDYGPSVLEIYSRQGHTGFPSLDGSSYSLTRLHLSWVRLPSSFTEQLSSDFPVLQDLELSVCLFQFHKITSRTLKNLLLDFCFNRTEEPVIITAPRLATLRLNASATDNRHGVLVKDSVSLIKASIRMASVTIDLRKNLVKLLGSLNNVKILELSDVWMQDIFHEELDFPTFHNLRTLLFQKCHIMNHMQMFWRFLQNAPGLKKLTLWCCEILARRKERPSQRGFLLSSRDSQVLSAKT